MNHLAYKLRLRPLTLNQHTLVIILIFIRVLQISRLPRGSIGEIEEHRRQKAKNGKTKVKTKSDTLDESILRT